MKHVPAFTASLIALSATQALTAQVTAAAQDTTAVVSPAAAPATDAPPIAIDTDKWKFALTPYFWLGAMDGDLSVKGRDISIHQDLGDVVDLIEDHLNFGLCVHFEAEKGRWGIFSDVLYMDLSGEHTGPGGLVRDVSSEQFVGELGGFYTLIEPKPRAEGGGSMPVRLDALAGFRVTWLENAINPALTGEVSETKAWIDPIVGARVAIDPTDWLRFSARGDIGGFDLAPGTTSKFAWQLVLDLSFRLSSTFNLELGYRWLSQDYEEGSGLNEFVYDITTAGPFIGMTIKF